MDTRQLTKFMLSFLIIVVIASVLIIRLTPFGAATSPDSISYLNAAQNISAGNGIVLTNYHIGADNQHVPLTIWPPLYPLVLSVFTTPSKLGVFAASQMAILTLSISGLLMFVLLRRVVGNYVAIIAALFFFNSLTDVNRIHLCLE